MHALPYSSILRLLWVLVALSLLVAACGTLAVDVEPAVEGNPTQTTTEVQQPGGSAATTATAAPTATAAAAPADTAEPSPSATAAVVDDVDPLAGLVYGDGQSLYMIGPAGQEVAVTNQSNALLSPDGRWAVYAADDQSGQSDIWLLDLRDGQRRNLTNTPDRFETEPRWWAARPESILFFSAAERMMGTGNPTVVGVDGSGYRVIDEEEGGYFDLDPLGRNLVYGGFDSPGRFWHWGAGTEAFDPAAYGVPASKLYRPALSPDGQRLAWQVGGDFGPDGSFALGVAVFDLSAQAGTLFHVYQPQGGSTFPSYLSWSADGQWLAFVTFNEPGAGPRQPALWVARPDGSDEQRLGPAHTPVWAPTEARLAYTLADQDGVRDGVGLFDPVTGEQRQLLAEGYEVSQWLAPSGDLFANLP
ncbi:MAG: hypothetical protein R3300_18205 [Candidatus Promineifilaceae bacterium]|nr:hypothetical protein [Candidatus Promineifilaceae bacterium]